MRKKLKVIILFFTFILQFTLCLYAEEKPIYDMKFRLGSDFSAFFGATSDIRFYKNKVQIKYSDSIVTLDFKNLLLLYTVSLADNDKVGLVKIDGTLVDKRGFVFLTKDNSFLGKNFPLFIRKINKLILEERRRNNIGVVCSNSNFNFKVGNIKIGKKGTAVIDGDYLIFNTNKNKHQKKYGFKILLNRIMFISQQKDFGTTWTIHFEYEDRPLLNSEFVGSKIKKRNWTLKHNGRTLYLTKKNGIKLIGKLKERGVLVVEYNF